MSAIIGVDLGNENCVIALPRKGGVDVVNNQSSQRLTPTMVAYDETRRYAGEFARSQQMQNVQGTITNLKRLVGLKYDDPRRVDVEKLVNTKLVKLPDGFVGLELDYCGQTKTFRVEQVLALMFSEVIKIAQLNECSSKELVVVCSPWWGEVERRVVLDAARVAGVEIKKLLNSTTAQAICYSMYFRKKLPEDEAKAVPVIFVDFGDSSLNVSVAKLSNGTVEIKAFTSDEHFGGSDFTNALQDLLLEKTIEQYKIDPRTSARAMIRFRAAVEKFKKVLSSNPVVRFEVPTLMNDIDVKFDLKREEFDERTKHLVQRIDAPIEQALKLAGVDKKDLHAIEIHGGASRVHAVKAHMAEIFGRQPTQSLNADECFALGAGYQAAIISPQYRVPLKLRDVCPHKIMIEYVRGDTKEKVTKEVFSQFNSLDCTKQVPLKVSKSMDVRVFTDLYDLGSIHIETGVEEVKTVFTMVRLTSDAIVTVTDAFEEREEKVELPPEKKKTEEKKDGDEEKKEEKEGDNEEKKEEPKFKIVKKQVKVEYKYTPCFGMSDDAIKEMKQLEKTMADKDVLEEKIDHTRNELESYIYNIRSGVQYDWPEFFDPSQKDDVLKSVQEAYDWFSENEYERLPLEQYEAQLNKLRAFGEPAIKNRELHGNVPVLVREYVEKVNALLARLESKEPNLEHISAEERKPAKDSILAFREWLSEKEKECQDAPKHMPPPLTSHQCVSKLNQLEDNVQKVLSKPKPKPKVEEKKPEPSQEKPAEKADADKAEGASAGQEKGDFKSIAKQIIEDTTKSREDKTKSLKETEGLMQYLDENIKELSYDDGDTLLHIAARCDYPDLFMFSSTKHIMHNKNNKDQKCVDLAVKEGLFYAEFLKHDSS